MIGTVIYRDTLAKNSRSVVVDTLNHCVQLFNEQGGYLSQFGSEVNLDHQLSNPYGLSVDRNGNIIVADMSNKLLKNLFSEWPVFV